MKAVKITAIAFIVISTFGCNSKQSEKAESNSSDISKPIFERSVVEKADKAEQKDFKQCDSLITVLVKTSPRYKQITKGLQKAVVKNGGSSFGIRLEASPNPNPNKPGSYSKTYDFTVYEMYLDRKLNTARFSFNPTNKQLYEYDEVHDSLKPIEFDRNLLISFESRCK